MRKLFLAFALIGLLLIAAAPSFAAQGATITSLVVNTNDCTLIVTITVQDAGDYFVQIWDDGVMEGVQGGPTAAGATVSYTFTIGPIGTGAPGIGVLIRGTDQPFGLVYAAEDPYTPDFGTCSGASWAPITQPAAATGAGCRTPVPAGYRVTSVPAGALAYYAADAGTYTGFNLPAGRTWYVAPTAENGFVKVWIACDANMVYVPEGNVVR
jgi:hypothetical protein